jgi:peptide chain release factor subunit 1
MDGVQGLFLQSTVVMTTTEQLSARLDELTSFDAGPYPVISLYLNLQPGEQGRDQFHAFVRTTLPERIATYEGPERESLDKDAEAIGAYLDTLDPAANGLALFASSGAGLFHAIQLAAPVPRHLLYVSDQPHLYPLAHLVDQYPRYAVVVADTQTARVIVVAANQIERTDAVEGPRTKRHKAGGWSQTRFQRHVDEFRSQHAKEVVDALTRLVRDEQVRWVIVGGDEVISPLLREHMPKDVAERVIDVVPMDIRTPHRQVLERALELTGRKDQETDRERVAALLDNYRSGGLGTIGVERVRNALELGQVDELLITAQADAFEVAAPSSSHAAAAADRSPAERIADELVAKARHTGARLCFIEDPALLEPYGGVGAFLRFLV